MHYENSGPRTELWGTPYNELKARIVIVTYKSKSARK